MSVLDAKRKAPVVAKPDHALSIGGLAQRLGVPRQRVYDLVKSGKVKAETISGAKVISPREAARVLDAATVVDTPMGSRLVFNFV
jgi:hypothetical protein